MSVPLQSRAATTAIISNRNRTGIEPEPHFASIAREDSDRLITFGADSNPMFGRNS
jgi:hypothetical protein